MKIKEVEERLGVSRATVRFYEKNGLLSPKRTTNSYRDYNDEDVAELRRVIMLRKQGDFGRKYPGFARWICGTVGCFR